MEERRVQFMALGRVTDRLLLCAHAIDLHPTAFNQTLALTRKLISSPRIKSQPYLSVDIPGVGVMHCMAIENGHVYCVIADPAYPQRTAFSLLRELARDVEETFAEEIDGATEEGCIDARHVMEEWGERYDDPRLIEHTHALQHEVDELRAVMHHTVGFALRPDSRVPCQGSVGVLAERGGHAMQHTTHIAQAQCNWHWKVRVALYCLIVVVAVVYLAFQTYQFAVELQQP